MHVNLILGGSMKPPPPQYLYRDVPFHPPEADRLADTLAAVIRRISGEKSAVDSSNNSLNFNWEGRRKEDFVSEAAPHANKIASEIEYLRTQEAFFRTIRVTRREPYLNPEWEAFQSAK
jgi:hypothetical protein